MVDEIPNSSDMIFNFFGKRESITDQARYSLSHGAIEPFNIVGFAALFADLQMSFGRENTGIRGPKIGISESRFLINEG